MTVEQAVAAYVRGDLSMEQFEKRIEMPLLYESGRAAPVPPGWEPLPECKHEWVDVSGLGSSGHELLCIHCPEARWEP